VITHPASDIRAGQVSTATYWLSPLRAEAVTLVTVSGQRATTAQTTFPLEFSGG
jgi:hypothetical protein